MNTKIDCKRIFTFLGITFGITIAAALVIALSGYDRSDFSPLTMWARNDS